MQPFNTFNFQPSFQSGFSPGVPFYGGPQFGGPQFGRPVGGPRPGGINPAQMQQMFKMVLGVLMQLAGGYQGFGGQQQGGFGGQQGGFGGGFGGFPTMPQPSFPNQPPFGFYPSPGTPIAPGGAGNAGNAGNAGGAGNSGGAGSSGGAYGGGNTGGAGNVGGPTAPAPSNDLDFSKLSKAERTNLSGLNDTQRGALHLWGIQVTSEGKNNGGIYFNVLENPGNFQKAEVDLVRNLYNQEMAMFGGVTGKLLDQQFFGVYGKMTGEDISQRYGNRPIEFAKGPVNMDNRISGNNGLSSFDNTVIRLWGHDGLDNGAQDGSVAEYTLNSDFALDKVDGSRGALAKGEVEALLAADLKDGKRDGNALNSAFIDSLDKIYFGGEGANVDKTLANAGVKKGEVSEIISDFKKNPPPGIPPGVDISDMSQIHKCPVLGPAVTQQGGAGGIQFG